MVKEVTHLHRADTTPVIPEKKITRNEHIKQVTANKVAATTTIHSTVIRNFCINMQK